jgi:outer membrane murein-binding lipoprotein Lpp
MADLPVDWLEWAKLGWAVLQTVVTAGIGWHLWMVDRQRLRRDALDRLRDDLIAQISTHRDTHEARLDKHHDRLAAVEAQHAQRPSGAECAQRMTQIARLEQQITALPTTAMMREGDSRAHQRIDQLSTGLSELRGAIGRMERTLDQISEHLLNRERA